MNKLMESADRFIAFGDGTVLVNSYASEAVPGILYLYIEAQDATLRSIFDLLYEQPDRTGRIVSEEYGERLEFAGYEQLFSVRQESERLITAGLKRQ